MRVTTTSLAPRSGSLGVQLAAHLQRRTSFHLTKPRIDQLAAMTADAAVNNLFDTAPPTPYIPRPLDPNTFSTNGGEWIDSNSQDDNVEGARRRYVAGWWFRNAIHDPSATHKLAFFIHTFFTVSHHVSGAGGHYYDISRHFYDHLALLNYAAENNMNLKTLAKKMTLDNQMLFYLQNRLNKASGVNENYAREFLELFTIGIGEVGFENYTEADITEFARLLTGFTVKSTRNGSDIDPDTGIFTGYTEPALHDSGDKTFSDTLSANGTVTITGRSDAAGMIQELDEFINMVFNREETARNYARKIYRFYVSTSISDAIENSVIDGLTNDLIANGYDLVATLKLLLKSEHFYSMCTATEGGGNIIKSPLELLSEALSFFNTDLPALSDSPTEEELYIHFFLYVNVYFYNTFGINVGIELFDPVNVAGYPAYYQEPLRDKNWYNGTTIPTRYDIGRLYTVVRPLDSNGFPRLPYTYIDTLAYANYLTTLGVDVSIADEVVDAVVNYLLPQPLTPERRDIIKNIFLNNLSPINWKFVWQAYINDANNFGDEARLYLNALVVAVLSAQEFQLK